MGSQGQETGLHRGGFGRGEATGSGKSTRCCERGGGERSPGDGSSRYHLQQRTARHRTTASSPARNRWNSASIVGSSPDDKLGSFGRFAIARLWGYPTTKAGDFWSTISGSFPAELGRRNHEPGYTHRRIQQGDQSATEYSRQRPGWVLAQTQRYTGVHATATGGNQPGRQPVVTITANSFEWSDG